MNQVAAQQRVRTVQIVGVLGVIHLIEGAYLVVVKSKQRVGEIQNHVIWKVGEHEIIPFKRTSLHLSKVQVPACKRVCDIFAIKCEGLYFLLK